MIARQAHTASSAGDRIAIFPGLRREDSATILPMRQKIALIGGFRPRQCGIATFTTDIYEQLKAHHPEIDTDVYAMSGENAHHSGTDADLCAVINDQDRSSYLAAAKSINASGARVAWIQHEYGIFGGDCGEMVLELLDRIACPIIVTLHTILADPSPLQRRIVERFVARATRIMVMSQEGESLLKNLYGACDKQVVRIEHGAPDRPFGRQAAFREVLGLSDRRIIMTFGLLGPGKGLETAIEALAPIVARHPDVVYRIVGATHPNLVRAEGERYRESLVDLANRCGVGDHVLWDNRFLDRDDLLDQLEACDIYLTPYPNLDQSTSGTLSYAVALGKAVISTPYIHAREILADGIGSLVPVRDVGAIVQAANRLLDDPINLQTTQERTYARGRATIWTRFADAAANLVHQAAAPLERAVTDAPSTAPRSPSNEALRLMTDGTGIIQHGIGPVPDRRHGYCLDDNARALMLVNRATGMAKSDRLQLASTFASFIQHAWNEEKRGFRNFMAYDRQWCEDLGSEDSNGRAIWVFGDTAAVAMTAPMRAWGADWFSRSASLALSMQSPRAMAFAMLGAASLLTVRDDRLARNIVETGGEVLARLLDAVRRPDWVWFETVLGYDNPRLPDALIQAGISVDRADWVNAGLDSLRWICRHQVGENGLFRPVGSDSFGHDHQSLPFDQQPLEAWAAIAACRTAYAVDGNVEWRDHAHIAWNWYLGHNDRSVILGDLDTGFCRDGITSRGANENRGAESLLAFQLAYHAMMEIVGQSEGHDAGTDGCQVRKDGIVVHPA